MDKKAIIRAFSINFAEWIDFHCIKGIKGYFFADYTINADNEYSIEELYDIYIIELELHYNEE